MTTSGFSDFEKKLKKFMELFIRVTLEEMPVEKLPDDACQRTISYITRMICIELNKIRSDTRFKFICFATIFPFETRSVFIKRSTLTDTPIGIEYSSEFIHGKYKCFVWLIGISY
jgi:hypothetical protein